MTPEGRNKMQFIPPSGDFKNPITQLCQPLNELFMSPRLPGSLRAGRWLMNRVSVSCWQSPLLYLLAGQYKQGEFKAGSPPIIGDVTDAAPLHATPPVQIPASQPFSL